MKPDYEIELGRGIGTILLGISKNELKEILGAPSEIVIPEDPEKYNWESYQYDSINCSFSFDPDHGNRLVEISVENGYFHIFNKIRIGISKTELLNSGTELKLGEFIIENMSNEEFPNHELITYARAGLKLWLDDGIISMIQISPVRNKEDKIIWPQ